MKNIAELLKIDWKIIKSQKKCVQKILEKKHIYHTQAPIFHALKILGKCNQATLADFLAISPASVAVSLKRLSKLGFITRTANEKDLRYNCVSLTEKGLIAANFSESTLNIINEKKFKGFSNDEIDTFINFYTRIKENLKDLEQELNI